MLASGSNDDTIKIWDATTRTHTRTHVHTLESYNNPIYSMALSPNGRILASGCKDGTIKIWDTTTDTCTHAFKGHSDSIYSVTFSRDGQMLASGSCDRIIKIWDTTTGTCTHTFQDYNNKVYSVAFSPNGWMLASGSSDNTIKIWDATTGTCMQTLKGHSDRVDSIAFSPDGRILVSGSSEYGKTWLNGQIDLSWTPPPGSQDYTIKVWDATTGTCMQTLKVGKTIFYLAFDRTGLRLNTEIGTIDLNQGLSPDLLPITTSDTLSLNLPPPQGYSLQSDTRWITWDGEKVLWLPSEYRPAWSVVEGLTVAMSYKTGRVLALTFSGDKLVA
jgi:WD40 repeat protein